MKLGRCQAWFLPNLFLHSKIQTTNFQQFTNRSESLPACLAVSWEMRGSLGREQRWPSDHGCQSVVPAVQFLWCAQVCNSGSPWIANSVATPVLPDMSSWGGGSLLKYLGLNLVEDTVDGRGYSARQRIQWEVAAERCSKSPRTHLVPELGRGMDILQACPVDALLVFVTEERDTFEAWNMWVGLPSMMYKIVNNLPGVFPFKRTLTWGLLWWSSGLLQRLRHCAPNAGGPGSIPGPGTRSYMP